MTRNFTFAVASMTLSLAFWTHELEAAPPAIPGATSKVPWDSSTAPFDVEQVLQLPADQQNAAALYLDALLDFSSEVSSCLNTEDKNKRRERTLELAKRYVEISNALREDANSVEPKKIDALIADYAPGFQKLRNAQQRKHCVFETGLSFSALLPHAQACRHVARLVDLKSNRDLATGNIDTVLSDIELTLRLANDVRNRGFIINHLVSIAIEAILFQEVVPRILRHEKTTAQHCHRLLQIIQSSKRDYRQQFLECCQIEYLSTRTALHDLRHRVGDFTAENKNGKQETPKQTIERLGKLLGLTTTGISVDTKKSWEDTKARFLKLTDKDYRNEVNWLDLSYYRLKRYLYSPYTRRKEEYLSIEREAVSNTVLVRHFLPSYQKAMEAFVRGEARYSGTECLVAVKHWQLTHKLTKRPGLQAVMKNVNRRVPIDPYADRGTIKLSWDRLQPTVYSIGSDTLDQNGAIDWKYGSQPGDFLFTYDSDVD